MLVGSTMGKPQQSPQRAQELLATVQSATTEHGVVNYGKLDYYTLRGVYSGLLAEDAYKGQLPTVAEVVQPKFQWNGRNLQGRSTILERVRQQARSEHRSAIDIMAVWPARPEPTAEPKAKLVKARGTWRAQ